METLGVRLEPAQVQALEALAHKRGLSKSEVLRELVERGLKEESGGGPEPAPGPNPTPAPPRPGPSPIPGPTPPVPPAPSPAPAPSGPSDLPDSLALRQTWFREDAGRFGAAVFTEMYRAWTPKLLALVSLVAALSADNPAFRTLAFGAAAAFVLADGLWPGRNLKLKLLDQAARDANAIAEEIPKAWDAARRTKSPQAAEQELAQDLDARRERLGRTSLKDLGL